MIRTRVFGNHSTLTVILQASRWLQDSLVSHLANHPHHAMPASFLGRYLVIVRIAVGVDVLSERQTRSRRTYPDARLIEDRLLSELLYGVACDVHHTITAIANHNVLADLHLSQRLLRRHRPWTY
jgi:hypothetical protein